MSTEKTSEIALQKQVKELQETIEGFKFCQRYSTDKKSFQYAMKLIQCFELYIYKTMILFPFIRDHFRQDKLIPQGSIEQVPIKKIAVLIHAYYPDVLEEIFSYLKNIPSEFDLYLNVPENIFFDEDSIPFKLKKLYRLPNIGKDMACFIHFLKDTADQNYDLVLKLHTKKSGRLKNEDGNIWRKCLLNSLVGSTDRVQEILNVCADKKVGLVGTKELYLNYNIRQENIANFESLLNILKIKNKDFGYHAGTMFWFKPKAFAKLVSNPEIHFDMFRTSKNQDDGDIEHAFERIFALCAKSEGYKVQNFSLALN